MKRLLAVFLCISLLFAVFPCAVASGVTPFALPTEPEIMPLWEHIQRCQANLSIDQSGKATVTCSVYGISATVTKVEIEAKLQRSWGLFWITEETFTVEKDSFYAILNETCTVESGYTYRIKAKITVYSGTDSESTTIKSNEVTY